MEKKTNQKKTNQKKINQKNTQEQLLEQFASKFKRVDIKEIERGDVIYIENKPDAVPYLLIDKGSGNERFILIEDLKTHFGYLYHFTNLFKLV